MLDLKSQLQDDSENDNSARFDVSSLILVFFFERKKFCGKKF